MDQTVLGTFSNLTDSRMDWIFEKPTVKYTKIVWQKLMHDILKQNTAPKYVLVGYVNVEPNT